jgi:hypothetical protein
MDTLFFTIEGKKYSGYIISDTNHEDHYYWFVFNDDELINQFGDSIAFYVKQGVAKPVYTHSRHQELIKQLQLLVQQYGVNKIMQ